MRVKHDCTLCPCVVCMGVETELERTVAYILMREI